VAQEGGASCKKEVFSRAKFSTVLLRNAFPAQTGANASVKTGSILAEFLSRQMNLF